MNYITYSITLSLPLVFFGIHWFFLSGWEKQHRFRPALNYSISFCSLFSWTSYFKTWMLWRSVVLVKVPSKMENA